MVQHRGKLISVQERRNEIEEPTMLIIDTFAEQEAAERRYREREEQPATEAETLEDFVNDARLAEWYAEDRTWQE